jgi:A/G-specific adenine glycosylase
MKGPIYQSRKGGIYLSTVAIKALSEAEEQQVLKQWQGLGYYSRARNILKCARICVEKYNGQLPGTMAELLSLPGIGPYTAAAVASIAFNTPEPLVDANVRRVMMRILAIRGIISTQHDKAILLKLNTVIPEKLPGHFNQAMMELGALICVPNQPRCNQCPVRIFCKAYDLGIQELIPEPNFKIIKEISAVVAIIEINGKILIQQRPAKGLLAGLWEFPGGKIEPGDAGPKEALKREIMEETGLSITINERLGQVVHFYTQFKVNLTAFVCTTAEKIKESDTLKLVNRNELATYPMPSGSAKLVDKYILKKS